MGSGIRPKKRLGQHFMRDFSAAERLVQSMEIQAGDTVLEIGPGEGVLTQFVMNTSAERIVAVEIDERLASVLESKFGADHRFRLVLSDFMKVSWKDIAGDTGPRLRVLGNIPYNITSPILFRLLDHRNQIRDAGLTVQKEVGQRLASSPGSKIYGIPSVLFQAFSDVEILYHIPRGAFHPVPDVDSAAIRIQFTEKPKYPIHDIDFFTRIVRQSFGQRRKMLRNTLKPFLSNITKQKDLPVDLQQRPEALSVSDFVQLSNALMR